MIFFIFFYFFLSTHLKINDIYFISSFFPRYQKKNNYLPVFQVITSFIFINYLIISKIFFQSKNSPFQRKILILHQNSAKKAFFLEFSTQHIEIQRFTLNTNPYIQLVN